MKNCMKIKKIWVLDGDKMKFRYHYGERVGGNGFGLSETDVSFTLNTVDRHMVGIVFKGNEKRTHKKRTSICQSG